MLTVPQLVKKLPSFYGTRRFIAASKKPAVSLYPKPGSF
jgi:hypothetical protein